MIQVMDGTVFFIQLWRQTHKHCQGCSLTNRNFSPCPNQKVYQQHVAADINLIIPIDSVLLDDFNLISFSSKLVL